MVKSRVCGERVEANMRNRLIYFFIYTVRVKGWSFGLGLLSRTIGKGVDAVTGAVKGLFGKKKEEGQTTA